MQKLLIKPAPQLIGLLLLYTGVYKLIWPAEASTAIESIGFTSTQAAALVMVVTIIELYLGTILIMKLNLRFAMLATTGAIFCFTVYLWYLSTLAHPPGCGCFGLTKLFLSNKHNAVFGILRNCAILLLLRMAYRYQFETIPETGQNPQAS